MAGCAVAPDDGQFLCSAGLTSPDGQTCIAGFCRDVLVDAAIDVVEVEVDAGRDAGEMDAEVEEDAGIDSGVIDPEEQARFKSGLVDLKTRQQLYKQDFGGVQISEQVLYQSRISLPSNVSTGTYTAETFAVRDGRVIASALAEVEVKKVGFERIVAVYSQEWALVYGLLAVALSVGMGWAAGRLFALI